MTDKQRIAWIDIAKGIAIILVVIGHCIPDAASSMGISVTGYRWLHDIIYSFHMPLFFFLSGYIIVRENMVRAGKRPLDIIKSRWNRLMIPYVFVGLCYAPFKLLLSKFANKPYDIGNIWKMIIGVNPDGELWFLYALFVITTIVAVSFFHVSIPRLLVAGVLLIWNPWNMVTNYLFFFLFGIYMRRDHSGFVENIKKRHVILLGIIFFAGNYGLLIIRQHAFFFLTAMSGMTLVFWLSYRISMLKLPVKDYLAYCGIMSMDIYILSDIIKIPFRIILWNKMHFYTGAFLVCTIMGIGLSLWVSQNIIRKSNILKRLLLGM